MEKDFVRLPGFVIYVIIKNITKALMVLLS